MSLLYAHAGGPLIWMRPGAQGYELVEGEEVLATVRFRSGSSSLAFAACGEQRWSFKPVGFLQPHATLHIEGAGKDLGSFRNRTLVGGGALVMGTAGSSRRAPISDPPCWSGSTATVPRSWGFSTGARLRVRAAADHSSPAATRVR